MKSALFNSKYKKNFQVLSEERGQLTRFPRTDQLPILWKALNQEFTTSLPDKIRRVDHRGSGFRKLVLNRSALMFCNSINANRDDGISLLPLPGSDLVTRPAIVQRISDSRSNCETLRFHTGEDSLSDIYMNGKRIAFSHHAIERFSNRTPNYLGEDFTSLLVTFFGQPIIAMPTPPGRALIVGYGGSLVALPYKETADQFTITTCLSLKELMCLEREFPPEAMNLHYEPTFVTPTIRHWRPTEIMKTHWKAWERKPSLPPIHSLRFEGRWQDLAYKMEGLLKQQGHDEGTQIGFLDKVPGPFMFELKPGQPEPQYNELELYKSADPSEKWDEIFEKRHIHKEAAEYD